MYAPSPLVERLAHALVQRGCTTAYGVTGAAIGRFTRAAADTGIRVVHTRHEGAAGFMATEHALATASPTVVFATSGPGLSNALTGLVAAAWEGAHVIAVIGGTPQAKRGRLPFQSTTVDQLDLDAWMPPDVLFAARPIDGPDSLPDALALLDTHRSSPTGSLTLFLVPSDVQALPCPPTSAPRRVVRLAPERADLRRVAAALRGQRVLLWVGQGARFSVDTVRQTLDALGAVAVVTPRAKGILPDSDPRVLGTLGLGGARLVAERVQHASPDIALVLGARFSEFTSWWDDRLAPPQGFILLGHEDPGEAYEGAPRLHIQSAPGPFLEALLPLIDTRPFPPQPPVHPETFPAGSPVHPGELMRAVQDVVLPLGLPIIAEAGNAFAWATRVLSFEAPTYRVSPDFGSMGQASAGVVGMALAHGGPAVALVGDGAMLMNTEISTAVATGARAIWIVLNDAAYGMIDHGMQAIGLEPVATAIPRVDFVGFARSQGANGVRIEDATDLREAFEQALEADGPFVIDVPIDGAIAPPFGARNDALRIPEEAAWRG